MPMQMWYKTTARARSVYGSRQKRKISRQQKANVWITPAQSPNVRLTTLDSLRWLVINVSECACSLAEGIVVLDRLQAVPRRMTAWTPPRPSTMH